ncbi:MAG: hypothetical protein HGA86_03080 [Anaerolineaceae bacterium]|nr:hypothetical protein [Anaerolineaceae bacterium]
MNRNHSDGNRMKNILILFVISIFLVTSGCNLPTTRVQSPAAVSSFGVHAWLDAPLDGSILPLAPYKVVWHASDDTAVTESELRINDQVVQTSTISKGDAKLVTFSFDWNPSVDGYYVLIVRGKNSGGVWSEPSSAKVFVGEYTPTPTLIPTTTLTPTPTITLTPTPTSTPTETPTPVTAPIQFLRPRSNISTVYVYGSGCGRKTVDVHVTIPNSSNVEQVTARFRLTKSRAATNWISVEMYLGGDGSWIASLTPDQDFLTSDMTSSNDFRRYINGAVNYQFSAVNMGGTNTVDSPVYSTVKIVACDK